MLGTPIALFGRARTAELTNELGARISKAVEEINKPTTISNPPPKEAIDFNRGATSLSRMAKIEEIPALGGGTNWQVTYPGGTVTTSPARRTQPATAVEKVGRALKETVMLPLEGLGLGSKGGERVIGAVSVNTAPVLNLVVFPNGEVYQPTGHPAPSGGAGAFGSPTVGPNDMTVRQITTNRYGDTPKTQEALRQIERMYWSGADAQMRAVARIVELGQPATQAIYGDGTYVARILMDKGWADDPIAAIKSDPLAKYWYDKRMAEILAGPPMEGGVPWTEKGANVQIVDEMNSQGLPGEQRLSRETVGNIVADPLWFTMFGEASKVVEASRVEEAYKWFGPIGEGVGEVVKAAREELRPVIEIFGKKIPVAGAPWTKTPSAVLDALRNHAEDAAGQILTQVTQEAAGLAPKVGPAVPIGEALSSDAGMAASLARSRALGAGGEAGVKLRVGVLQAYVDMAEPIPVRLATQDDAAFANTMARWQTRQDAAASLLSEYPTAQSRAGKLGAAYVRALLQDEGGNISGATLRKLMEGGDANKITEQLFSRYAEAGKTLLMPERQGYSTVAAFVEGTGRPVSEFPVFERGMAGATERVRLAKAAMEKGIKYPVSPVTRALAEWNDFQHTVNSGLWKIFGSANPGYSARNFLNNLTTTLVDGKFSFTKGKEIDAFLADIGKPVAASRGIGVAGALPTKVGEFGFSGHWKPFGIPIGAQAVEEAFSRRIVYATAKDYLDRMMVVGKAIPELPPSVTSALGEDAARGLFHEISRTYGDAAGAIKWLKKNVGSVEFGRIMADEDYNILRSFDPKLANEIDNLMKTAKAVPEFDAAYSGIKSKLGVNATEAEKNIPRMFTAQDPEYATLVAEKARPAPGDSYDTFQQMLNVQRERVGAAYRGALDAVQGQPDKAAMDAAFADFRARGERVNALHKETTVAADAARNEAWRQNDLIRGEKGVNIDAKRALLDENWNNYFNTRNQLWTDYAAGAEREWRGLSVTPAAVPPVTPAVQAGLGAPVPAQGGLTFTQAVTRPRAQLPQSFSDSMNAAASEMSDLLSTGEPGRRIFTDVSGAGGTQDVTGLSSGYQDWYKEYFAKYKTPKRDVLKALDKIMADKGLDKGVTVSRLKEEIVRMMADGYHGMPPDPDALRLLGYDEGRIQQAIAEWKALGYEHPNVTGGIPPAILPIAPRGAPSFSGLGGQPYPENVIQPGLVPGVGQGPSPMVGSPNVAPLPSIVQQPGLQGAAQNFATGFGVGDPLNSPTIPDEVRAALARIENGFRTNFGQSRPFNLSPDDWKLLQAWGDRTQYLTREAKGIAGQVGTQARNFTLLNYGDRRNIDQWLSVVFPYSYWYTRTPGNWLQRAVLNPQALANYGRYRQLLATAHAALPEYWRQQLSTEDLGIRGDHPLMFNLEATLSPLNGILGTDFTDPVRRRASMFGIQGVGGMVEDASSFGMTVWSPIIWAMALANARSDPQAASAWLGYLGQPFRAARSLTALLGEATHGALGIPPGGINLDPQVLVSNIIQGNGFGVTGMTPSERNRVANAVFALWDKPPEGTSPEDWHAQITDQFYAQSGPLWDKAVQDQFVNTSPAVMASYLFGVGFKGRGQEELQFQKIVSELQNIRSHYGDWTPEQISTAYQDLRQRQPMSDVLMLARADGPARDDKMIWDAMSRTGTGNYDIWKMVGVSQATLDAFYQNKSTETMPEALRKELVAGALALNARLAPQTEEEARAAIAARAAKRQLDAQLHQEFGSQPFDDEQKFFQLRDNVSQEAADSFLQTMPPGQRAVLEGMWSARNATEVNNPALASYASVKGYQIYQTDAFYAAQEKAHPGIRDTNDAWKKIKEARGQAPAEAFLKLHPELKEYWTASDRFYNTDLPKMSEDWVRGLDKIPTLTLRSDTGAIGAMQQSVDEFVKNQQGTQYVVPQPKQAATGGQDTADAFLAQYDQQVAAKAARQGYMTTANKDTFETTLFSELVQPARGDVKQVMARLNATQTWDGYAPDGDVLGYIAASGGLEGNSLREAMMLDTTSRWAHVAAAIRQMTPDQIAQLQAQVPDIGVVAGQLEGWDKGASEAARIDIVGYKFYLDPDGTITLTKQTQKAYYGPGGAGASAGGGGGGGGAGAGAVGAAGGAAITPGNWAVGGKWYYNGRVHDVPQGFDWNKYYGGEGLEIPGHPRPGIPKMGLPPGGPPKRKKKRKSYITGSKPPTGGYASRPPQYPPQYPPSAASQRVPMMTVRYYQPRSGKTGL